MGQLPKFNTENDDLKSESSRQSMAGLMKQIIFSKDLHPLTGPGPENLASILGRLSSQPSGISANTIPIVKQSAP